MKLVKFFLKVFNIKKLFGVLIFLTLINCANANISSNIVDQIYQDKESANFLCSDNDCDFEERKSRLIEEDKISLKNGNQIFLISSKQKILIIILQ